ncbi:MAG: hypothetical protein ACI87E_000726 [Mariniblastus sp.]|jgi:hypothetical protein
MAAWLSPDVCHRPVSFEDRNLKRFGNLSSKIPAIRNAISAERFQTEIPLQRYRIGQPPPDSLIGPSRDGKPGWV